MDIGKYEIFADVAETKNFTKTGDRLGYTQPAVSRTLKMLERDMGFPLFIRGSSGVELTDEAMRILPFVYQLLADNNRLIQKISDINGLHTGHLSIACFSSISRSWLPHMLALFRQEYPGISVELMEGGTDDIVGWVSDNIADFGLLSHRHTGSLEWISLCRDPLVAVLPKQEPYLSMSAFPIEEMNRTARIMTFTTFSQRQKSALRSATPRRMTTRSCRSSRRGSVSAFCRGSSSRQSAAATSSSSRSRPHLTGTSASPTRTRSPSLPPRENSSTGSTRRRTKIFSVLRKL